MQRQQQQQHDEKCVCTVARARNDAEAGAGVGADIVLWHIQQALIIFFLPSTKMQRALFLFFFLCLKSGLLHLYPVHCV